MMVRDSLKNRVALYAPILHPGAFIEERIKTGIREYEAQSNTLTGLNPDSLIRVDYAPLVPANPNLRHEAPVKKSRYFTLTEVVTGSYQHQVQSWRREFGNRFRVVGHQHQALINHLTRENLETQMTAALKAYQAQPGNKSGLQSLYKSEVMQRCLAYLTKADPKTAAYGAVADFLSGNLQAREVEFHGATLSGVFLIPVKSGGILFSVDDATHFEIGSATNRYFKFGASMSEQVPVYPMSEAFKQWISSKLPVYEQYRYKDQTDAYALKKRSRSSMPWLGIGVTQGQVYANPFSFPATSSVDALTERFYDGFMARLKSDIDTLVFTEGEQSDLNALEIAKTLLTVYSTAGAFAAPGIGSKLHALVTSLLVSGAYVGASFGQAAISDRPQQADEYLKDGIISAAVAGALLAAPLVGKFAKGIRYPFKSIPQALGYYRLITEQAQKKAPRIIRLLKQMTRPRVAGAAGGVRQGVKQMRRASIGEVAGDIPATRPTLSTLEQSREAIKRSLPIARAKLDAAIRAAADPKHIEDTQQIARLFYGSDTPETLKALQRKQHLMKADLGQLKMDNIEFLPNEEPGWSAQLQPSNYNNYKGGAPKEKYIEVNVDGAMQYYRDMGSSDDTLANTLIHEMSHGMPMDEDFVYAGKLRGAREDIVDLLNLGKSTDPKDFRYLSADAKDGTVSLFAREPKMHNADSTLFVTALLDQAMNNRPLFETNMAAINEAVARSGGDIIQETVAVRVINKPTVVHGAAPAYLIVRDDQTGRLVGVFGKIPAPEGAPAKWVDRVREVFKWH
ncbi:hypothetical protein DYL61_26060 [Pseudomonas nabeulensis]|uniref:Uncharacterized protein n=2 Tax=Pseudomonas nabeulensis TaxID=2293833 RepID=A0A4Z0AM24_9PSED|nr:hypothetical protein DYL61_26060 [Pseudomonas nabeulensis]